MSTDAPRIAALMTRDELRAFTARSNLAGAYAVLSTWLVIAGCFALVAVVPLAFPLAVVVVGGRQLALAVLVHEAAHHTLFRTRWLDDHVVDLLCARPVWSDVARYRKHHLGHHAHTGTARDPDLALAFVEPMSRASLVRKIVRDLTGVTGAKRVVGLLLIDAGVLRYDVGGRVRRQRRRGLRRHARDLATHLLPMLVMNGVLVAILAACGCAWVYLVWVVAYLTWYSLVLRVRSLAEHAGLVRTDDVFANTRTTRASWLARATVAPFHVNYHLEHHLVPTVPWFRLPAFRRMLEVRTALAPATADYGAVMRAVTR